MSNNDSSHAGSCHCGAVRYDVSGSPGMTAVCYCSNCQKSSGAGHVLHLGYGRDALKVEGDTGAHQYTAESGARVTKSFCTSCGTNLFGETSGMPGFVMVAAATLDAPSTFAPQVAVFTKRRQSWDHDYPDIPAFEAMPPAPE